MGSFERSLSFCQTSWFFLAEGDMPRVCLSIHASPNSYFQNVEVLYKCVYKCVYLYVCLPASDTVTMTETWKVGAATFVSAKATPSV